ncbi:MAG TPA: TonB-dependent siderophore receptor [Thermoanaerobaculia bacterium]|nr:TonB-dependent siderophore receptor [Thermoanaerobaculia bacterium]
MALAIVATAVLAACPPAVLAQASGGPAQAPAAAAAPQEPAAGPPLLQHHEELVVKETAELVPAVTAIARLPLPTRLLPASVDVIGAPLLEQQDARVLGDALKNASGVGVHTESGVADLFVVRGLDSETSALVMTDGAPEPVTTFYQLYNAERVELLKGPASFLYGGNPLAGAVNIVRKQPLSDPFVQLSGLGGSFGTRQGAVDGNWSGQDGRLGLRLNGLWQATDGWRDGRSGRAWGANPTFAWRRDADSSLILSVERVEDSFHPDAGLPLVGNRVAGVPVRRSYQSPFDRSDQRLSRLQLDWQGKAGGFTLHDKAYYRELSWRSDGTLLAGVFPDFTGRLELARALVLLDDRQRFWGNQLEGSVEARTGRLTHQLMAGVELARRGDNFTLDVGGLPPIDLLAPVETARRPVVPLPGQSAAANTRMLIAAPYVLDRVLVSERFQLLLGGRFDHLDYRDRATATARRDSQLSPMAGAVFSPAAGWSIYANAGRGFAPPSTRVAGPRRPETGTQAEAGLKSELLGGRLRGTLAVYDLRRRNQAIPDANGFTEQSGSERSRGVELELVAHRLAGLDVVFSYAYDRAVFTRFAESVLVSFAPPTFATIDRSGKTPPLAPAHIANLWLTRRLPGGLELAAGGRYVSRQFIAADDAFAIPGAFTADAALSLPLGPLRGRIEVKNLTGERTYTRGLGTTSVIPASGRAVYAGFEARWTAPSLAPQAPAPRQP